MVTDEDVGQRVRDSAGNVGILTDLIPDYVDPDAMPDKRQARPTAFLRPVGGGTEWLASPDAVTPL